MLRRMALALLAPLVLAACGTSTIDPAQQLKDAAAALKSVKTVQLDFKFGPGAAVTVSGTSLNVVSATGKVRLPSDSELVAKVQRGDAVIEATLITLGGTTYFKPISFLPAQQLSPQEAAQYPNAARLMDPDKGLPAVIPRGQNAKSSGTEAVDGQDCYKIEADFKADDVKDAIAPFTVGDTHAVFWIGKNDHLVRRARISGKIFNASDSFIEVHLHDFNANVDITQPG